MRMPDVPDNSRKSQPPEVKAMLLGLGFDNTDGHTRITRSDEFTLIGGSNDTHEHMQEKATRFTEELGRRGKRLGDITPDEFLDIADRVKLNDR
jgi:hypothetical protein